jgi:hypothetical protein
MYAINMEKRVRNRTGDNEMSNAHVIEELGIDYHMNAHECK